MENRFTIPSIERIFKHKFYFATHVQLLWKERDSFQTLFDAINSAGRLICLQFYIFKNDDTGIVISELLKKKSREGTKVYILYDHCGSIGTPRRFWRE